MIYNFTKPGPVSIDVIRSKLGLRMSHAELTFCAKHYKSKDGPNISISALRMLDALACPIHISPEKIAVGEMLTSCESVAMAYRDAIDKLNALGRSPETPITLQDIARLPTRFLQKMTGKHMQNRIGAQDSVLAYAAQGYACAYRLDSPYGSFDALTPLPFTPHKQAQYADALVLLYPPDQTAEAAFDHDATMLLYDSELALHVNLAVDIRESSILHAVLDTTKGAVINTARLPEGMQEAEALAAPVHGLFVAIPQSALPLLQSKAAEKGIGCHCFGVADHAGDLIVKSGTQSLFSMDINYLKTLCLIRSYTLRLHENEPQIKHTRTMLSASATGIAADMQSTPKDQAANHISLSGAPFAHALTCAADAYCAAVAAGGDPETITLHVRLQATSQKPRSRSFGDALSALLGLHKFSMDTLVQIDTRVTFDANEPSLLVLADLQDRSLIPDTLQGQGYVSLLHPQTDAHGMPDTAELARLASYLHHHIKQGNITGARALCGCTPGQVLDGMTSRGCTLVRNQKYADLLCRKIPGAIIVESKCPTEGELIAFCGAVSEQKSD